jgi:hypothetical protein
MKPRRALRQIPASDGKISPVIAPNSGKFIAAFCRHLPRVFTPRFFPTKLLGDGVSQKSRLSSFRKPSESRSAERIKLDDEGRSERPFLKSERTERLWSRGILETDVDCAAYRFVVRRFVCAVCEARAKPGSQSAGHYIRWKYPLIFCSPVPTVVP